MSGELSNYATSSSVTSAISSALSSYDNSSQVDSKIITALLDFYTRAEVDQEIADALGDVDLSSCYYTSAQTDSLFYPARSWTPSSRPPSCSTGPAGGPKPRSTTPSPARAS